MKINIIVASGSAAQKRGWMCSGRKKPLPPTPFNNPDTIITIIISVIVVIIVVINIIWDNLSLLLSGV